MFNAGIDNYFNVVLTAERAGVKKPHLAIFEQALKKQMLKRKSLNVGDSYEADIAGALTIGMQAIHFNSHCEKTHHYCPIVESLAEMKQYL